MHYERFDSLNILSFSVKLGVFNPVLENPVVGLDLWNLDSLYPSRVGVIDC